ncbi:DUF5666 domain-containing protein [Methylobacterium sp. J-043]|nr:DUF5666 domain-containing protein [Methylobacterium sp. J-043]
MSRLTPTRRGLLALLAGTILWRPHPAWPQTAGDPAQDRGIGGTGARPSEEETPGGDRGIGGTGVIGTIRRFGSIVVNDLRITYPPDVQVRIDGTPARVADLKVGHVVRVVARGPEGALSTRAITVSSEVVGPVEAVARGRLTVLGQSISTASLKTARTRFAVGERVAVSGLRRADGTIVASLIEPRADGSARVAGPVRRDRDGTPRIGGLRLAGLEPGLTGRRALVEGEAGPAGLTITSARDVSLPFPAGLARASIEAYVAQGEGGLRLGSGFAVSGGVSPSALPGSGRPAVIETGIGRDGRMTVESVRGDASARGQGPGGQGAGGQGSGGQGPGGGPGGGGFGGQGPGAPGRSGPGGEAPFSRPGGRAGGFESGRSGAPGGNATPGGYPIDTRPGPGGGPGSAFGAPSGGFGRPGDGGPGGFGGGGGPGGFGGGPGGFGGGGGPGGFGGGGRR